MTATSRFCLYRKCSSSVRPIIVFKTVNGMSEISSEWEMDICQTVKASLIVSSSLKCLSVSCSMSHGKIKWDSQKSPTRCEKIWYSFSLVSFPILSPMNTRITWDQYFMGLALLSAQRSKDTRTNVGACIVDKHNRIIGIGYNGFPRVVLMMNSLNRAEGMRMEHSPSLWFKTCLFGPRWSKRYPQFDGQGYARSNTLLCYAYL